MKVVNPTENLLEVLYLPEVQNCSLTPGEREEMVEVHFEFGLVYFALCGAMEAGMQDPLPDPLPDAIALPDVDVRGDEGRERVGGRHRDRGGDRERGRRFRGSCSPKDNSDYFITKKCNLKRT